MESTKFAGVSTAELERRWTLLRNHASEAGLDAILTLCNDDDLGGYMRWFTDEPVNAYRKGVIFYPDDLMTLVEHGGMGQARPLTGKEPDYRGIGMNYGAAEFPSVDYTLGYEADIVIAEIKRRGLRKVGLVGEGNMPYRFVKMLRDALEGSVAFSDETAVVDGFMVIKSEEELALIRRTAALQDDIFSAVLNAARPGMRDVELTAIARGVSQRAGGAGGIILAGSAPQGSFAPFRPINRQNRVISKGDYLSILIENSGPGGYFTEMARGIVFGKAEDHLKEAVAATAELQASILTAFKPGTPCADIFALHNEERKARGLPPENRIFAHGQGYNLVERPLIRQDETMTVQAGMNFAVHPTVANPANMFAVTCDNYIVGENGVGECLHRTEKRVFEID